MGHNKIFYLVYLFSVKVLLVVKETRVQQVSKVFKVQLGILAARVLLDPLVQLDKQASLVHLVIQVPCQ
jgi:hypothetical protein